MSEKLPKRPEKRHYKRIEMELPVRLEMNGKKIEATTENVSCGGMFLPMKPCDLKVDEHLTAFVSLPERAAPVKLSGRVCRIVENPGAENTGVAVEFSGLYDENQMAIDHLVKWKLLN